jgi:hypothetical protein
MNDNLYDFYKSQQQQNVYTKNNKYKEEEQYGTKSIYVKGKEVQEDTVGNQVRSDLKSW